MSVQVTAIMLGVEDLSRSRKFYADGLGCAIDRDHPGFVSIGLAGGRITRPAGSAQWAAISVTSAILMATCGR